MPTSISDILDVLDAYGIHPLDDLEDVELPGIGEIEEDETVYSTSIAGVFGEIGGALDGPSAPGIDDPRLYEWWNEIERIIEDSNRSVLSRGRPSRALENALIRFHGYQRVPGGKGSHVKLAKASALTIIIPANRPVISLGVLKHALQALGGYPISRLLDLLNGRL